MPTEKQPTAIDLAHHLSDLAVARQVSPLKGLAKYYGRPGVISLAGGMPSPDYFPLANLAADALVADSFAPAPPPRAPAWLWRLFGAAKGAERTEHLCVPKYAASPGDVSLAVALQYGTATGVVQLQAFVREFTARVFQPQYADFATLVHAGNTDGWSKALATLCNPGEMILVEEWTYPSALASALPHDVRPAPVAIDGEGMRVDALRTLLAEWDPAARGAKRPHVMYTVPIGQNPTGATMGAARKQAIYAICVEFDVIIVEDDPYYFLQQGAYFPKPARLAQPPAKDTDEDAAFLARLAPSYLRFDYQGRVVRLDSFSKIVAPGARLGWFTCAPLLAERLERQGEVSTQAPCGFSQVIITQLLTKQWGQAGLVRWLRGLRTEYTLRRDFFVDSLADAFLLQPAPAAAGLWAGCTAYTARARPRGAAPAADEKRAFGDKTLFSFVPPTSGMFIWLKIHFDAHPAYAPGDEDTLEQQLFTALAEAGLLVGPGWFFATSAAQRVAPAGHLRISFSNGEFDVLRKGVDILRTVLDEFFETM